MLNASGEVLEWTTDEKLVFYFHFVWLEAQRVADNENEGEHDEANYDAPDYHLCLLFLLCVTLLYFSLVFLIHILVFI